MSREQKPLTEFQFYVLVGLAQSADGGLHGYGIVQAIEQITNGLRKYALPSLYETLRTLATRGLIELDRTEEESGRLRKYFRITGPGVRSMKDYYIESEKIQRSVRKQSALKPANG